MASILESSFPDKAETPFGKMHREQREMPWREKAALTKPSL
jgi:hypothetical protein